MAIASAGQRHQHTPTRLPPPVAAALWHLQLAPDAVRLCTETDVSLTGTPAQQWLTITDARLLTFAAPSPDDITPGSQATSPAALVLLDLRLRQLHGARTDVRIGSGMLEVEIAPGVFRDVIRYTNVHAVKFGKIAHKLHAHLTDQRPLIFTAEDEADPRRCWQCGRIVSSEVRGTRQLCPRCLAKGTIFVRLLGLLRPYWPAALAMLLALLVGIALDLVPPRLTAILIDSVFGETPVPGWVATLAGALGPLAPEGRLRWLLVLVLALLVIRAARAVVRVINEVVATSVGTRVTAYIRGRMYERLHTLSISYYDHQSVGQIMSRLTADTDTLHTFFSQISNGFLVQIIMLAALGTVMFTMSPQLTLITLIPAPLVIGSTYIFWYFVLPRHYAHAESRSRLANVVVAALSGMRVVKAFGQEPREIRAFEWFSQRLRRNRRQVDMAAGLFYPTVGFVFSLGGMIVWYAGGAAVLANDGSLSLGELIAFLGYLGMFYAPMNSLTLISQWLTTFLTSAYRIFEILDAESTVPETSRPRTLPQMRGAIACEQVTFGYDPYLPVLHDFSLSIEPGEMIGIVGPSGSGKTTIVNLICRFYDPTQGTVRIDGVDLREVGTADLRRQIGLVLQEPYLFRGTIRDNIAYGRADATIEQIMRAARAANAHDFILRFPDGYDTRLGEHGAGLSGGERQRLSIARALLTDPRILILDEATSSVDTESELAIQEALATVTRGRTTIAIAHRLSTLRNADRIAVLEHGRLKELGTHEELMRLGGLYHKLVSIQLKLTRDSDSVDALETRAQLAATQ